jgi:hypothetical protein
LRPLIRTAAEIPACFSVVEHVRSVIWLMLDMFTKVMTASPTAMCVTSSEFWKYPNLEDASHILKREIITHLRTRLFNLVTELMLAIFEDSFQQSQGLMSGE